MLKVTIVKTRTQKRLILEGALIQPWVAELKKAYAAEFETMPRGRQLVVDLNNVTTISKEGEDVLSELMQEGAKFSCAGVLTKYLLKQISQRGSNNAMSRNAKKN